MKYGEQATHEKVVTRPKTLSELAALLTSRLVWSVGSL